MFSSTRARIVAAYTLVLVVAAIVSMVTIREVLLMRLDQRTDEALRQEVLEPPLLVAGIDPSTGRPFGTLQRAFDVYLDRNVPSIEEAFIALVAGDVAGSQLRSFPGRTVPRAVLAEWADFSQSTSGPDEISGSFDTEHGEARFRAVRVAIGEERGAFVVAILPAAELSEIRDLQAAGAMVVAAVVACAALCTWLLAGRVLRPIRDLTEAAHSISEWGHTNRLHVDRGGEAADLEVSFNAMLDRLEAAASSERNLFYTAGHELRAPLTVAAGHLELMQAGVLDQQSTLPIVLDELTRMGKLIDDLQLLIGASGSDFVVPDMLDVDLFADELLAKMSALAERAWRLDGASPGVFCADRFRLTEAVLNLADNAVAHTSRGDEIGLALVIVGDEVHLRVRDTGVGLLDDDVAIVFERFRRGRDANQRYRGSGLGLAIVRSIAAAHGGRVEVASEAGRGATFTMIVPAAGPAGVGGDDATDPDR